MDHSRVDDRRASLRAGGFCLLVLGAGALAACSPFNGYEPRDPCDPPALVPERPRIPGGTGDIEEVMALRYVDLGDREEGGQSAALAIGFDLDGQCSRAGDGNRCRARNGASDHVDGPGGRDNSVGANVLLGTNSEPGQVSEGINSTASAGLIGVLIRVRNYNGAAIDNDVEVAYYGGRRPHAPGEQPARPAWDGNDGWNVFDLFLQDLPADLADVRADALEPRFVDGRAYVTAHQLVASFSDVTTAVGIFSRLTLVATLEQRDERWFLTEGTMAGRIPVDNLLAQIAGQPDPRGDAICTDHPLYEVRKRGVCALADVNAQEIDEPAADCDAASWAWRFEAEPVVLQGVVRLLDVADPLPCALEVSPALDSCK